MNLECYEGKRKDKDQVEEPSGEVGVVILQPMQDILSGLVKGFALEVLFVVEKLVALGRGIDLVERADSVGVVDVVRVRIVGLDESDMALLE